MHTKTLSGLAATLLASGLTLGIAGQQPLLGHLEMVRAGLLLTLGALPLWLAVQIRRSQQATADQLAAADRDGYYRALDHVARGLLDVPAPAPTPGDHDAPDAPVRHLRTVSTYNPPERQAQ